MCDSKKSVTGVRSFIVVMLVMLAACGGQVQSALAQEVFQHEGDQSEQNKNLNWTNRKYQKVTRSNWRFMVEDDLMRTAPDVVNKATDRLVQNLDRIMRVTPPRTHGDFTRLTFYVMEGSGAPQGGRDSGLAFYRPGAPLHRQNLDPAWNDVVVVYSAKNYCKITDLWACKSLMHELGHAYHLHHWAEQDPEILAAWQNATAKGLYRGVKDVNGKTLVEAYAAKNQLEYFAELSAAYFVGINYFPFDRPGLAKYDPVGYRLIERYWNR